MTSKDSTMYNSCTNYSKKAQIMQEKLLNWKNKFCWTKNRVIFSVGTNISPRHNLGFGNSFLDWLAFGHPFTHPRQKKSEEEPEKKDNGDNLRNYVLSLVLRIYSKFTWKHLCWSVFLIKLLTSSLQLY